MSRLPTKKLNPNEILFKEGSVGELAYVIKKGSVEISVMSAGQEVVLAILEPPAIFGEMALIFKEEKRTATVTALEYTELVQIEKQTFEEYFKKSPPIMEHIVNTLVSRLKRTTDRVGTTADIFIGTAEILNLLCASTEWKISITPERIVAISNGACRRYRGGQRQSSI